MFKNTHQRYQTKRYQLGQAMPLGIAFITFCVLIGLLLFNTGQLVSVKSRVVNTADSAVYSGLLWQSRALNFQSYTNRAMVANQVTVAQAVSLNAWSLYGQIATENVDAVLGSIPYVNLLSAAMETVLDTTVNLVQPISGALLSFVNSINDALSASQTAMYAAAFAATPEIVQNVTKKNDPNFSADTAFSVSHVGSNLDQWRQLTQEYTTDDDNAMTRRATLINQSRDEFSTNRDWEFFNSWFYIAPFVKFKLHKRGETRLLSSTSDESSTGKTWEWKGKDTLSFNTRIWRPFKSDKKIELPIGWGQAYVNQESLQQTTESSCRVVQGDNQEGGENTPYSNCERWFDYNRSAEYMSDNNIRSLSGTESRQKIDTYYTGMRAYRDLANLGAQDKDPRLLLRVEIESDINTIETTKNLGIGGHFFIDDHVASGSLASIASGEVYFKKPLQVNQQNHVEHANAYNPFWDTRLINTPEDVRTQALLLRGVPVAGALIQSVGSSTDFPGDQSISQLSQYQPDLSAAYSMTASAYEAQIDESVEQAGYFDQIAQLAEAETHSLGVEFEQIKEAVAILYEEAILEIETAGQNQIQDLDQQILALEESLGVVLSDNEKTEIEAELSELRDQQSVILTELHIKKAEILMEIVNNSTSVYQMDFDTAFEIVGLGDDIGESLEQVLRVSCGDEALDADDTVYVKDEDCEQD